MATIEINHNTVPQAIAEVLSEILELKRLLIEQDKDKPPQDKWMDLDELVEYDPEKRSKTTFYGYSMNATIPCHRRGKKLIFLKSQIDAWLREGRKKTGCELEKEVENHIRNSRKKKH